MTVKEDTNLIEKLQEEVQESCGAPVALRPEGTSKVKCPHSGECFDCDDPPGHVEAPCEDREKMPTIGDREFFPNCGFTHMSSSDALQNQSQNPVRLGRQPHPILCHAARKGF